MEKPVLVLAAKGIVEGTTATEFSPGKNITRGEFIMWLVNTLGLNATFDDNFVDVQATDKYYKALGIAKKLGIAQGTGGNKFNPKSEISRQDLMVLTIKALKIVKLSLTNGNSTDLANSPMPKRFPPTRETMRQQWLDPALFREVAKR